MKSAEFSFSFADILNRLGGFSRDIGTVGDAKGRLLSCRRIDPEYGGNIMARLWMSDFACRRYYIMSVTVFFDPLYEKDIIIIPEFKLSFRYQWNCSDFRTDKVMSIVDELCNAKVSDSYLCEWQLMCVAVAVCAVYVHVDRLSYETPEFDMARELLEDPYGDIYIMDHC